MAHENHCFVFGYQNEQVIVIAPTLESAVGLWRRHQSTESESYDDEDQPETMTRVTGPVVLP